MTVHVEPAPPVCIAYHPGWVADAAELYDRLANELVWEHPEITMFGRRHLTPRLTAWLGEGSYTYSGIVNQPQPWPPVLLAVRDRLADELDVTFDSCLANLYRDGTDSMGYHSDDEPELGPRPVIASVSLGARRRFVVRHRVTRERWVWELGEGDLLVMREESQSDYAHAVPKTTRPLGPRLNLTFRRYLG